MVQRVGQQHSDRRCQKWSEVVPSQQIGEISSAE